jgi:hypothetical protein
MPEVRPSHSGPGDKELSSELPAARKQHKRSPVPSGDDSPCFDMPCSAPAHTHDYVPRSAPPDTQDYVPQWASLRAKGAGRIFLTTGLVGIAALAAAFFYFVVRR